VTLLDRVPPKLRRTATELVRFAMVGVIGLAVNITVLKLFLALVGDRPYSGEAVAFMVAVTTTWWCNRQFTFRDQPRAPMLRQWAHFVLVNSTGAIANYATYAALVASVALCRAHPELAVAAGAVAGIAFNFSGARRYVFKG
jgi:putative flippase GtrA